MGRGPKRSISGPPRPDTSRLKPGSVRTKPTSVGSRPGRSAKLGSAGAEPGSNAGARHQRLLLVGLIGLAMFYLALRPWLRRMGAETERLRRETAARQAE